MDKGFAFIDLETTGFGHKSVDRIVEVAVITTDENLQTIESWSTLVNPLRDPGPTGIHGIRAEWLAEAPTFSQILSDLQSLVHGRTLVVHNASFDVNFLKSEFRRAGLDESELSFEALCTLRLSREYIPSLSRYKLNWIAHELGLRTMPNHSALADTEVTLELGRHLEENFSALSRSKKRAPKPFFSTQRSSNSALMVQRPTSDAPTSSNLLQALGALPLNGQLPVEMHEYLELLDLYLLDDEISELEAEHLLEAARLGGLGQVEVKEAHEIYFNAVFSEALSDGVISIEESKSLRSKSEFLGVGHLYNTLESAWLQEHSGLPFGLSPGDSVVLTGDTIPPKELLAEQLLKFGLSVKTSVSKKTKLVAAADVSSQSGKASKARELGIPVVSASDLSSKLNALNKR
jgi:DNA polymerase-3 subunit epsilon